MAIKKTGSSTKRASRRPPTAATGRKRTSISPVPASESVTDAQIRERAYYLYLQRDGRPGDPLADWLRAEHELAAGPSET